MTWINNIYHFIFLNSEKTEYFGSLADFRGIERIERDLNPQRILKLSVFHKPRIEANCADLIKLFSDKVKISFRAVMK